MKTGYRGERQFSRLQEHCILKRVALCAGQWQSSLTSLSTGWWLESAFEKVLNCIKLRKEYVTRVKIEKLGKVATKFAAYRPFLRLKCLNPFIFTSAKKTPEHLSSPVLAAQMSLQRPAIQISYPGDMDQKCIDGWCHCIFLTLRKTRSKKT